MKLKEKIDIAIGVAMLYGLIIFGVIAINARFEQLNQQKSATEPRIQIAQNPTR